MGPSALRIYWTGVVCLTTALSLTAYGDGKVHRLGDGRAPTPLPKPIRLILELKDGSRLVGIPDLGSVAVRTSVGRVEIPLKLVRRIDFLDEPSEVKILCTNQDQLHGSLENDRILLHTLFGRVTVATANLLRLYPEATPIAQGRVLYYPFDKDEGGVVMDRSGNENHGRVRGAIWIREGAVGGAMSFDGNASIDLGDLSCVENQKELTWSAWVYPTGSGLNGVMGKTADGNEVFYLNTHIAGATLTFRPYVMPAGRGEERYVDVQGKLKLNAWQHLAGTYDGTQIKAYCNGELVGSSPLYKERPTNKNHVRAAVGDTSFGRGWGFHGKIDEVMIFDRVLKGEEIRQLYEARTSQLPGD